MRYLSRLSILAAVGLEVFAQAGNHMHADLHERRGLSDTLSALGLDGRSEGENGQGEIGVTTEQAVTAENNVAYDGQETGDAIELGVEAVAQAGSDAVIQISINIPEVFASGSPPQPTVAPEIVHTVTEMTTVRADGPTMAGSSPSAGVMGTGGSGNATASPPNIVAGVSPSVGGVGTAGSFSASKTTAVAPTASPAAALVVGSPGAVVAGTGTLNSDGSCACQCLCGAGSFPNAAVASSNPAPIAPSTLQSIASKSSMSSMSSMLSFNLSSAIASIDSSAGVPSPTASSSMKTSTPVDASMSASLASMLVLTLSPTTSANPAAAADALPATPPANIGSITLSSSLILGNLASPSVA